MQKKYHILALGGIGMSAIARLLKQKGHEVSGEDKNKSLLLELLEKEGIYSCENKIFSEDTTVIYSTAIDKNHPQILQAKNKNLSLYHRSEILNELLQEKISLLVTGTHGKTTTSSLLAFTLDALNNDPSFALGGILQDKDTNAKLGKGKYFVAEADESDGSFLNLKNDFAIITNIEEDHLEYWENKDNLIKGYQHFCDRVKGMKFFCLDCPQIASLSLSGISYGLTNKAQVYARDIKQEDSHQTFTIHTPSESYEGVKLCLLGEHNIQNALGVFSLLSFLGFDPKKIIEAFSLFPGVKRRMERVVDREDLTLIDDYAHHPTEIKTTLLGLKKQVRARRVIGVFQPHRANRFKDYFEQFCSCFDGADFVVVTDVYQVGKEEKVDVETLVRRVGKKAQYVPKEKLLDTLHNLIQPFDVLITLGAGDVNQVLKPLSEVRKKLKVALLFGGPSLEHEVSIDSAKTFYEGLIQEFYETRGFYLDKDKCWYSTKGIDLDHKEKISIEALVPKLKNCDVCIPSFHGTFGEDGTIQGFLETIGVRYASPRPLSCALAMHKGLAKRVVSSLGVKTAKWIEVRKGYNQERVLEELMPFSYPLYVKPCSLGSTYGVTQVLEEGDLFTTINRCLDYQDHLLIEETLKGDEVEVGIIGAKYLEFGKIARVPINNSTYTFSKKYGSTAVKAEIPAQIDSKIYEELIVVSEKIYRTFEISSHARIDYFIVKGEIYFNEINAIPGMTQTSAFPMMYQKSIQSLINDIVICSLGLE